jgi:hypothetical protein
MDWIEIKSSRDAKELLDTFGGFHDGCIKELKYIGGEYVSEDLSMMQEDLALYSSVSGKALALSKWFLKD